MRKYLFRLTLHAFYIVLDCICIFLSVFLAYGTYHAFNLGREVVYTPSTLVPFALGLAGLGCVTLHVFGAYRRESGILNVLEIRSVILSVLVCFAVTSVFFLVVRFHPSRYTIFLTFLYMILLLPLARSLVYAVLSDKLPRAYLRQALVYGAGELGQRLYREIQNSPRMGVQIRGCIDDDPAKRNTALTSCGFQTNNSCRVLGDRRNLAQIIQSHGIEEIYIAISNITNEKLKELIALCRQYPVKLAVVPNLYDIFVHKITLDQLGNLPLIREGQKGPTRRQHWGKRGLDLVLCALLALPLLPVMTVLALAIRLDSRGPVLFKQDRVGKDGRVFQIYKFRSMSTDAPKYAVNPHDAHDPRITRVGRFLRRTSLDELPQIFNVLRGEMSFVGPRPEMPFIVEQYTELQRERLAVLPGITGLWQLSGDRKKAIHENMDYDLYYIYNQSFFLDATILLQTLIFAFRGI